MKKVLKALDIWKKYDFISTLLIGILCLVFGIYFLFERKDFIFFEISLNFLAVICFIITFLKLKKIKSSRFIIFFIDLMIKTEYLKLKKDDFIIEYKSSFYFLFLFFNNSFSYHFRCSLINILK